MPCVRPLLERRNAPGPEVVRFGASPRTGVSLSIVSSPPVPTWDNVQFGGRFQASLDWLQGVDVGLTCYRGFTTLPSTSFSFEGVDSQTSPLCQRQPLDN